MRHQAFKPHVCGECHQTTEYDVALSRGAATLAIAFYNAIRRENRNIVHFGNDMVRDPKDFNNFRDMVEGGWCTHKMSEAFVTVLHRHGIIASRGNGEWVLTPKGAAFLRNEEVWKVCIADKTTGHQSGYWEPSGLTKITTLLNTKEAWWVMPEPPPIPSIHTYSLFEESTLV